MANLSLEGSHWASLYSTHFPFQRGGFSGLLNIHSPAFQWGDSSPWPSVGVGWPIDVTATPPNSQLNTGKLIPQYSTDLQYPFKGVQKAGATIDALGYTDQTGNSNFITRINTTGVSSGETYTDAYNSDGATSVVSVIPNNAVIHFGFYVRKSSSYSGSPTVNMFVFGVAEDYNFQTPSGYTGGNASSGTKSSPITGKTYYYIGATTATNTWTLHEGWCKMNGNTDIHALTCRIDADTPGHKYYYSDIFIHVYNLGMEVKSYGSSAKSSDGSFVSGSATMIGDGAPEDGAEFALSGSGTGVHASYPSTNEYQQDYLTSLGAGKDYQRST